MGCGLGEGLVLWLVYGDRESVGESYWEWEVGGGGDDYIEWYGEVEGEVEELGVGDGSIDADEEGWGAS